MVDLKDYLQSLGINDLSSWTLLKAHCISDNGAKIAGTATNSFGSWVTFVINLEDELVDEILGDLNNDSSIDILDVIVLVNYILNSDNLELDGADINNDGAINILDIVSLVDSILEN